MSRTIQRHRDPQPTEGPRFVSEQRLAIQFVVTGYRRAIAVVASTSFLGGLIEAVFLVTVARLAFAITDGKSEVGIIADRFLSINQTLVLSFILVALRMALGGLAVWQTARVSAAVVTRTRKRLTNAFLNASWATQQEQQGGSLQVFVSGYSSQAATLMGGIGSGAVSLANLIAMLCLAIVIDPVGALVMLASILALGALLRPIRNGIRKRAGETNRTNMSLAVATHEVSQLGMELHVFNVQDRAQHQLDQQIENARDASRRLQFATSSLSTVYSGLAYLALIAALGVIAQTSSANVTSLGAVLLVMLRSLSYGQGLQAAHVAMVGASPAIHDMLERLEELEGSRRHDGVVPVGSVSTLTVDHVSFAYPQGENVLEDMTFQVAPREIIGIAGPSGGGKSTLVQLLLGLRDPQEGSIRADDRDISLFAKAEWARKVTFVPQAAHLISGTIADNIRLLRLGISDEEVEQAAKLAHLHDEIMGFPEGYDRSVGENGGHLSGGQQQRLCIARALVEQPDILILDEPTSALDVKSEQLVRATLLALKERMTVIVIAHRLTTLDICDRIMVIQNGRLVGFDAPAQLAESNAFFLEALRISGLR